MRSVIGTAPSMFGPSAPAGGVAQVSLPSVLFACDGAHAAMIVAAAVLPVVKRNVRRVGFDGPDCGLSRIGPPCGVSSLTQQGLVVHPAVWETKAGKTVRWAPRDFSGRVTGKPEVSGGPSDWYRRTRITLGDVGFPEADFSGLGGTEFDGLFHDAAWDHLKK